MHVVLYTIGCPKCDVLEKKLRDAGIKFEAVTQISVMARKGMNELPVLEVDGERMSFAQAVSWIKTEGEKNGLTS